MGKLVLQEPTDTEICFIATGTGIAPLRSMIGHIFLANLPHRNIRLIFGVRTEADLIYRSEFETLEHQHPEFRFTPVLSRPGENWSGLTGYVHAAYRHLYTDHQPCTFYLCGWGEMVREARSNLEQMGYSKEAIRFESYG